MNDIKSVYPEVGKESLKMKKLEEISVESEEIGHLIKDKGIFIVASGSQDVNDSDSEDEVFWGKRISDEIENNLKFHT